jgi:LuxR family maltose regulon positive regulatory protein
LRHTNLARVLVAQGMRQPSGTHLHEVLSLLARLLEGAEKAGWIHKEVKILILQALALKAGGDTEGAMAALTQALTLAKPGGYVRTFVDEGAPMGELLRLVAARGVAPDYISQLLVAFGAEEQRSRGAGEQQGDLSSLPPRSPAPLLIEPLSERELQVLRLLATRLSTAEIAEGLFIAVSTLRTHAKSIYGKLDVHSRREAVARAQELGLL